MSKEFIPYEEAVALKELGFEEPTMASYSDKDRNLEDGEFFQSPCDIQYVNVAQAPLYQQAFRWFREKYKIRINTQNEEHFTAFKRVTPKMEVLSYSRKEVDGDNHYEVAELACLRKLIEIVKNKENENNNQ